MSELKRLLVFTTQITNTNLYLLRQQCIKAHARYKGQKNSDPWDIFFEKKVQLYDCSASFSASIGTSQKVLV